MSEAREADDHVVLVADVVHTILGVVDKAGGEIEASVVGQLLKAIPHYQAKIDEFFGLKRFCNTRPEIEFLTCVDGGWIRRRILKPFRWAWKASEARWDVGRDLFAPDVVLMISNLIDEAGGVMQSSAVGQMLSNNPCHQEIVDSSGGLKCFCDDHAEEIEFVTDLFGGGLVRRRAPYQSLTLPVKRIRWTQDTIRVSFKNGDLLVDLLKNLLCFPSRLNNIPPLDVIEINGQLYAISGNRRLWVLKEFARKANPKLLVTCNVHVVKSSGRAAFLRRHRFSTTNGGVRVGFVCKNRYKNHQRFSTMDAALQALSVGGVKPADACMHSREDGKRIAKRQCLQESLSEERKRALDAEAKEKVQKKMERLNFEIDEYMQNGPAEE